MTRGCSVERSFQGIRTDDGLMVGGNSGSDCTEESRGSTLSCELWSEIYRGEEERQFDHQLKGSVQNAQNFKAQAVWLAPMELQ